MKKIIIIGLVIVWCVVIYLFSNGNYRESNNVSFGVIDKVIKITNVLHITNVHTAQDMVNIRIALNKPVRKIAHIIEYFILAFLVFNGLKVVKYKKNLYLTTIVICFIYSLTDEFHQLFIFGRSADFVDCLIDSFGSLLFLILIYVITNKKEKNLENN